jgi:hypothetical protein
MCCFIVGLLLDVRFKKDLDAIAAVWSNDRDLVNAWGLITGFFCWLLMVINTFG